MGSKAWRDRPDLAMPLKEDLVGLTVKGLIACRECLAIADVSIYDSNIKLICPSCHRTLGNWVTASEAVVAMAEFVAKVRTGR